MKIAIFCGSMSDRKLMKNAEDLLKELNILYIYYIISAHRLPDVLLKTIQKIEIKKVDVIIAGAGLSAHLPGIISSHTYLPVIGVPIYNYPNPLSGQDSLFSMIQMPKGVPVATVGINNSYNAALLAIRILSIKYDKIKKLLFKFKEKTRTKLIQKIEKNL